MGAEFVTNTAYLIKKIVDGYQVEFPEQWLLHENVWEVRRHDQAVEVSYFGNVEPLYIDGRLEFRHTNAEVIMAVPYDVPVVGYETSTVNTLRLFGMRNQFLSHKIAKIF